MGKKYADYMDEISADDLYKGLIRLTKSVKR